ncbi:hypothetical protein L4D17_24620 [Vibrio splendidus]|uniref:hypothetical protein n=1 Tax=Vibrio splendidus TaxID=29497 RepID=UPI003D1244DF
MARSYPLQSKLKGQLEVDFKIFRDRESLNDAEATRQLLEFALRIKLNDNEDERPTNRELLEEIYRTVRSNVAVSDLTHSQTFNPESMYKHLSDSKALRKQVKADVNDGTDDYLSGKNKE